MSSLPKSNVQVACGQVDLEAQRPDASVTQPAPSFQSSQQSGLSAEDKWLLKRWPKYDTSGGSSKVPSAANTDVNSPRIHAWNKKKFYIGGAIFIVVMGVIFAVCAYAERDQDKPHNA